MALMQQGCDGAVIMATVYWLLLSQLEQAIY